MRRFALVVPSLLILLLALATGCADEAEAPAPTRDSVAVLPPPDTSQRIPPPPGAAIEPGRQRPPVTPEGAVDFALPTLSGDMLQLDDYRGRVVLLNFWATWCAPCIEEIPDLNALYDDLQDDGLTIIGISLDEEGAAVVRPFVDRQPIHYPVVLDPDGSVVDQLGGVWGLPTTFILGPDGRVRDHVVGRIPTEALRSELVALLDEPATP